MIDRKCVSINKSQTKFLQLHTKRSRHAHAGNHHHQSALHCITSCKPDKVNEIAVSTPIPRDSDKITNFTTTTSQPHKADNIALLPDWFVQSRRPELQQHSGWISEKKKTPTELSDKPTDPLTELLKKKRWRRSAKKRAPTSTEVDDVDAEELQRNAGVPASSSTRFYTLLMLRSCSGMPDLESFAEQRLLGWSCGFVREVDGFNVQSVTWIFVLQLASGHNRPASLPQPCIAVCFGGGCCEESAARGSPTWHAPMHYYFVCSRTNITHHRTCSLTHWLTDWLSKLCKVGPILDDWLGVEDSCVESLPTSPDLFASHSSARCFQNLHNATVYVRATLSSLSSSSPHRDVLKSYIITIKSVCSTGEGGAIAAPSWIWYRIAGREAGLASWSPSSHTLLLLFRCIVLPELAQ